MNEMTCTTTTTTTITTTTTNKKNKNNPSQRTLVIATRLHLGNASAAPPSTDKIRGWLQNLYDMAASLQQHKGRATISCSHAMIAVDAGPNDKILNYDYVQAIREQADYIEANHATTSTAGSSSDTVGVPIKMVILPVTPWGKFVPALNALVYHAHTELQADQILMVSAEVSVSAASIEILSDHCATAVSSSDDDVGSKNYVLVAGAALNGHWYRHSSHNTTMDEDSTETKTSSSSFRVSLNGRTCPWNTLAIWNVPKLIVTGFLPVSDLGATAGVEECAAIALHQKLFSSSRAMAKLVRLPDVAWDDNFQDDLERQQWHERKMNSKLERAEAQMKMLQLSAIDDTSIAGFVEHC